MGTAGGGVSRAGGNRVRRAEPAPTTRWVAAAPVEESLKHSPLLVREQSVDGFGILWGFFTSICASEGSRSLMGGSTIVMCVPLG